jgi:hypothetical protein
MLNNSTNINKANNLLSPHITEHKNKMATQSLGSQGSCLGQAYKCNGPKLKAWDSNRNAICIFFSIFSLAIRMHPVPVGIRSRVFHVKQNS